MRVRIAIAVITSLLLAFCGAKSHLIYRAFAPMTNYVGGNIRYYPKHDLNEAERVEVFRLMRQHMNWNLYVYLLAFLALPQYLQLIEIWYRKSRGMSIEGVKIFI